MRQETPDHSFLRHEVERKWGRRLSTTADFIALSEAMEESVSPSTLKRFWGYVGDRPAPRTSTLDSLARYAGFLDFKAFRENLAASGRLSSIYFHNDHIEAGALSQGDVVVIGWRPDRQVTLSYLGNSTFKVVESIHSLLRKGDQFEISCIMKGYPLALSGIIRDGIKTDPYVAGLDGGIAYIQKG